VEGNFFKKKDIIVIAVLLLVAGIFYVITMPKEAGNVAEISVDGLMYKTVDLLRTEDGLYQIDGLNVTYEIKDKNIRFYYSDCHDHVCMDAGFIGLGGESAVCLPNKVVISIPRGSANDSEIDIMLH